MGKHTSGGRRINTNYSKAEKAARRGTCDIKREKTKKKKFNSNFYILISIAILIIILILFLITRKDTNEPINVANKTFDALKNNELDIASEYVDYRQLVNSLDEMLTTEDNSTIEKELFGNIEWEIKKVEKDNDRAVLTVELKNKDFVKVITKWMKKIIGEKAKGNQITIDVSLQKLENALSETGEVTKVMKKINLIKEDDTWKIVVDEELRSLVYPSIDSVATALTQSGN